MTKFKFILINILFLLSVSQTAYASQAIYPIYALTDANTLYGVVNGIAALMNSTMFKDAFVCFGLLGFFCIIIFTAVQGNYKRMVFYLFGISLFISMALNVQVSVQVVSELTGETYEVNNVPGILAVPASWMSILGHDGAKLIDQAYASVGGMKSNLTLTGGTPFSISNQLMEDATNYQIKDSYLHASMIHFVVDCVVPAMANGSLTMTQLINSNNIWGLFTPSILNPSLMTINFGTDEAPIPAGNVLTCPESYEAINQILPKAQEKMIASLSKNMMAGLSASLFQDSLEYNVKGTLYNPKPGDYLQQAAILNLLKGPVHEYMADKSQSAILMQSLAVSQAVAATESSWITTAEVFAKTMGYIYSALQMLVFAISPILMLFVVFPGAGMVLAKRYFTLLAWFPMTFIMLAICNDLILSWTHNELSTIFNNYNGLVQGSQALITAKAVKMQAVGAFFVSVTPLISFGIVAGLQMPITSILSHSGALTFGSQAGDKSATGNESLDQQSYNNTSANKFNTTTNMDMGAAPIELSLAGGNSLLKGNFGGESALLNGAPDMLSQQTQTYTQHSQTTGTTYSTDQGGTLSNDSGFYDSAGVGQHAANSVGTSISGGMNFNKSVASIGKAIKGAAMTAGIALPLAAIDSAATGLAYAKEMTDKAYQAGLAGDQSAKQQYQQQSESFMNQSIHALKQHWDEADWKTKAAIGGAGLVISAGIIAAYGSGVGEVATVAGIAGASSTGGIAAAEGSAALGGLALSEVATTEGIAAGVGSGLTQAAGKAAKGGIIGGIIGGLTNGFNAGITERKDGSYDTRLNTDFGSRSSYSGQSRDSYGTSRRLDEQTNVSTSETSSSSFQLPSQHLNNALGMVNAVPQHSSIERAANKYRSDHYQIEQSSDALQHKIQALKQQTRDFHTEAKKELADHSGINQLSETSLQKNAKDRTVD